MEKIPGYTLIEKIGESAEMEILRCKKGDTGGSFIVRFYKAGAFSPAEAARFRHEHEKLKESDIAGVLKIIEIIENRSGLALIFEDFPGISLDRILKGKGISTEDFLRIAVQLAEITGVLHNSDIIHGALKPGNVLAKEDLSELRLTGFGATALMGRMEGRLYDPDFISGSLVYFSPEQTGRMNRAIDYRTDLYSLGITFFELLAGIVPFLSDDPVSVIHSHIAKKPLSPSEINPEIPEMISVIVMKLLSKNPGERYQSGFGLRADLRECRRMLLEKGDIDIFDTGKKDTPVKFIEPRVLYGREEEIRELRESFLRAASGSREAVFVSGPPGIGKTVLVNEARRFAAGRRGYFISGKYDQLNRDVPYSGIIQAFQDMARQVLTESEERIEGWKRKIQSALGPNGRIITDIIPEFGLIMGPQPGLPSLGPEESKNRFNLYFERFVQALAGEDHPVILFIDDIQWADLPGLQLLRTVASNSGTAHFMIACAYRDNEVTPSHPLFEARSAMKSSGVNVKEMLLYPLNARDIAGLIMDTLKCDEEKGYALSEVVKSKTGGNPFYINLFLRTLYNEKIIRFDSAEGCFFDAAGLSEVRVMDNIAELLEQRILELPEDTQKALSAGACAGSTFTLDMLSAILDAPAGVILERLSEALKNGFLTSSGDEYIFSHDRVQEAAYSLLSESERARLHYKTGRYAIETFNCDEEPERVFFIADQLNLGSGFLSGSAEREELARVNLRAGKKAKASAGYAPALRYLEAGISCLDSGCWKELYDLIFELYSEAVECAYLRGDYVVMEEFADVAIGRARDVVDMAGIYRSRIMAYAAQGELQKSIRNGLSILKLLGSNIPETPSTIKILKELAIVKLKLAGRQPESLIDLPVMTDRRFISIMQITLTMQQVVYYYNFKLFTMLMLNAVKISIQHGNARESAYSYCCYGVLLIGILGDIEYGYKYGKLALKMVDNTEASKIKGMVLMAFHYAINFWVNHLKESVIPLFNTYQMSIEFGLLDNAALSLVLSKGFSFLGGMGLKKYVETMEAEFNDIKRLNQEHTLLFYKLFWQRSLTLLGQNDSPVRISGEVFNDEKLIPQWNHIGHRSLIGNFYYYKFFLNYLFSNYIEALVFIKKMEEYIDALRGSVLYRYHTLYTSLTHLALYHTFPPHRKLAARVKVLLNQRKIKKWSKHAPMNNLHNYHLVEAEKARVLKKHRKAEKHYDNAIKLAREHEYLIEEGISNELAGKYYLARGREKIAKMYLEEAYACYTRWGAVAKLRHIEEVYPDLLADIKASGPQSPDGDGDGKTASRVLDTAAVVRATQAISDEIELDRLLSNLIKIIMENAGARKAVMLLKRENAFYIEAECEVDSRPVVLRSVLLEESGDVPQSMVRYTARTKEAVVLSDAFMDETFGNDRYIAEREVRSALCMPVTHKEELTAVLYLENRLNSGVFTDERQEMLRALAAQAAISLDNAFLYKNLLDEIRRRERAESERGELEKMILNVSEEERRKIGMELHDGLGHDLVEISMKLGMLSDKLRGDHLHGLMEAEELEERVVSAIKKNRDLARGLFPVNLEAAGFGEVLHEFKSELERGHGIRCSLEADEGAVRERGEMSPHLYYIIQEAVRNIIRHSGADEAWINVSSKDGTVAVSIEDNGSGVSGGKDSGGMGLKIMQYRAGMIGGTLTVSRRSGGGTTVVCRFPVNSA